MSRRFATVISWPVFGASARRKSLMTLVKPDWDAEIGDLNHWIIAPKTVWGIIRESLLWLIGSFAR